MPGESEAATAFAAYSCAGCKSLPPANGASGKSLHVSPSYRRPRLRLARECVEDGDDLGRLAGLDEIAIEADRTAEQALRGTRPHARDGDEERRGDAAAPLAYFARDRIAAHAGHVDVDDEDIRAHQALELEHLVAAQDRVDLVTLVAQQRGERDAGVAIVVGDEDAQRRRRRRAFLRPAHDVKRRL